MKTRKLSLAGECQLTNEEEMVELQKSPCEDHHSNNSSKKKKSMDATTSRFKWKKHNKSGRYFRQNSEEY